MRSFLLNVLVLHANVLKLTRYFYFHNHSFNICTISISLSVFPSPNVYKLIRYAYKSAYIRICVCMNSDAN